MLVYDVEGVGGGRQVETVLRRRKSTWRFSVLGPVGVALTPGVSLGFTVEGERLGVERADPPRDGVIACGQRDEPHVGDTRVVERPVYVASPVLHHPNQEHVPASIVDDAVPQQHAVCIRAPRAEERNPTRVGADGDLTDAQGSTPLHVATRHGHQEVAALLLDLGVDVNAANRKGSEPLHEAVFAGRTTMINLLLEHGADTRAHNARGESPIDLASANGDTLAVLIIDSASLRTRDPASNTPIGIQ